MFIVKIVKIKNFKILFFYKFQQVLKNLHTLNSNKLYILDNISPLVVPGSNSTSKYFLDHEVLNRYKFKIVY